MILHYSLHEADLLNAATIAMIHVLNEKATTIIYSSAFEATTHIQWTKKHNSHYLKSLNLCRIAESFGHVGKAKQ